jgi:hypothetical protein
LQDDIDLDRRVAAAVEDFAGDDVGNGSHVRLSWRWNGRCLSL